MSFENVLPIYRHILSVSNFWNKVLWVFNLALVQYFITMISFPPFGMVMHVMCHRILEVCDLAFYFDFMMGFSNEITLSLRIDFEFWTLNSVKNVIGYCCGLICLYAINMHYSYWFNKDDDWPTAEQDMVRWEGQTKNTGSNEGRVRSFQPDTGETGHI